MRSSLVLVLIIAACGAETPAPAVDRDASTPVDVPSGVVVTVLDHADRMPLSRADVRLVRGRERIKTAKTGADGTFDFGKQPPGEYVVQASSTGGTYVPVAERFEIDGSSGVRIELVLRAFEGQPLRVAVPDGVALPRLARLTYTKLSSEGASPVMTKISLREDGTATMRRLPPAKYRLQFSLPGCAPIVLEHEIRYEDNEPLVIAFEAP